MCVGVPDKAALGVDKGPTAFHYLNQSGTVEAPGVKDIEWYANTRASMSTIGLPEDEQAEVLNRAHTWCTPTPCILHAVHC